MYTYQANIMPYVRSCHVSWSIFYIQFDFYIHSFISI